MDKQEIYLQIQALLVKLFELDADDIKPESRLYEELELDSIDAVDLVVHLQKTTGKKIKPEMFKSVRTVQDVVDAIDELLKSEAKAAG
ncbi:acyl carrier protein [Streptococcus hongkongensis]|nr:acyl carrier protein [Streptococcus hongkongensis]